MTTNATVHPPSGDRLQGNNNEHQSTSMNDATEDDEVNGKTCVLITW